MVLRVLQAAWTWFCFSVKWSLVALGAGALFYNYVLKWNLSTALAICVGPFALVAIIKLIEAASASSSTPPEADR